MGDLSHPYPGNDASAGDLARLADAYRAAAHALLVRDASRRAIDCAPARLLATHAIELYLNALLLDHGLCAAQIRGMQHDLARRIAMPAIETLHLRKRTLAHIEHLSIEREYLVVRYDPDAVRAPIPITRLAATLDEVARKVSMRLTGPI